MKGDPCAECGHTEMNLVDGYYYCVECGTQDTNVRETIVEQKAIGDGTFAATTRRKLVNVTQKETEMCGEWYKWHAYNFILSGLADDLIAQGAEPSFKTKLLWIWTRYIKLYQNKEELGLIKDNDSITIESLIEARSARESLCISEKSTEGAKKIKKHRCYDEPYLNIEFMTKSVLMSMIYIALILDRSDIQLSYLYRVLNEGRISFTYVTKYFPEDFNLKAIPQWDAFMMKSMCGPNALRYTTMTLIRKLDLGPPLVPDLRKILNNIIKELCLPDDFFQLVSSLMHLCPCNYLTLNKRHLYGMVRIPHYEAIIMSYVLIALKMCFGLDDRYEIDISDAVDKYNEANKLEKSYKFGVPSRTKRLFSFREWCYYLKARKMMLCQHSHTMAQKHIIDIDDYIFMEHLEEKPEGKAELTDKIAMEILDKLPQEPVRVIPKDEFRNSFTPHSSYTEVILDYCQDPEFKYLLSEDFTQYSLKYTCEDLELIDSDTSKNIVVGVSDAKKRVNPNLEDSILIVKSSNLDMVYVKNCNNRNWMKTKPPTMDHVVSYESDEIDETNNEKDSDHGYDSNVENGANDSDNNDDANETEEPKEIKLETIEEEEEGKNIFDDDFEGLDCKAGDDSGEENNMDTTNHISENHITENHEMTYNAMGFDFEDDEDSRLSDITLTKGPDDFDPETFDRQKAIKELVIAACKKHKIPIPKEFKDPKDRVKTRKRKKKEEIPGVPRVKKICKPGQARKEVGELLNAYQEFLARDVLHKVSEQVKTAIDNFNMTQDNNTDNNLDNFQSNINEDMPNYDEIYSESVIGDAENENQQTSSPNDADNVNMDVENTAAAPKANSEDEETDEGEEDWRTEGDPLFDEKKYDVKQLYVKVETEELTKCFDVKDDPVIEEIISKKLKAVQKNAKKFMKIPTEQSGRKRRRCRSSDSDDELPLSELCKQKKFIEEIRKKDQRPKEPLIKNKVPVFKYWVRHYAEGNSFIKCIDIKKTFEDELRTKFPKSFYYILNECASIINTTSFHMYKHLQNLEKMIAGRGKYVYFDDL